MGNYFSFVVTYWYNGEKKEVPFSTSTSDHMEYLDAMEKGEIEVFKKEVDRKVSNMSAKMYSNSFVE